VTFLPGNTLRTCHDRVPNWAWAVAVFRDDKRQQPVAVRAGTGE